MVLCIHELFMVNNLEKRPSASGLLFFIHSSCWEGFIMGQIYRNYLERNCGLPSTRVHSIDEGVAAMHKGYAFCDTGYRRNFCQKRNA